MTGYYSTKLAGERLKALYDSAPSRILQYLEGEIDQVKSLLSPGDAVLELGCGYGRVMREIASRCETVTGIDTSEDSITLGRRYLRDCANCQLLVMSAIDTGFAENTFDIVLCIQNGISAFRVDHITLLTESLRVTRPGGMAIFSTYAEEFWQERLDWFEQQAREGFIGPIDYELTGNGKIVCTDGFTATAVSASEFDRLAGETGVDAECNVVDGSSLFCVIRKPIRSGG